MFECSTVREMGKQNRVRNKNGTPGFPHAVFNSHTYCWYQQEFNWITMIATTKIATVTAN